MNPKFFIFWYIFVSIITGVAIFFKLEKHLNQINSEYFEFFFLFGTIIYTLYMHINLVLGLNKKNETDYTNEGETSNFFKDILFKFLFVFIIGIYFIAQILYDLQTSFKSNPFITNRIGWKSRAYGFYLYYGLPLFYILDLYCVSRKRCPNPTIDIGIIFIICVVNFVLDFKTVNLLPNIGVNLAKFLFSFNGYIIYDYCLFKLNGGVAGFTLLYVG